MESELLIEIIIGGVAILGGFFALIKYTISSNARREEALLEHQESQQALMMEFYERKNGHLERIATRFTDSNIKMTDAISKLTIEIKVLAEKHKK